MKIDPHVHSAGASYCSRVTYEDILKNKKAAGYGGAILTNHCQSHYFEPSNQREWSERFINEWLNAKKFGEQNHFKFLFGIEVTIYDPIYSDWLLYGATPEFLRAAPCLYKLDQRQLFDLCNDNGIFLVEAHPYRNAPSPCPAKYMHGIEINCNPIDYEKKQDVINFANEYGLLITCGTDYHSADNEAIGGMVVPDNINDSQSFASYLKTTKSTSLLLDGTERVFKIK